MRVNIESAGRGKSFGNKMLCVICAWSLVAEKKNKLDGLNHYWDMACVSSFHRRKVFFSFSLKTIFFFLITNKRRYLHWQAFSDARLIAPGLLLMMCNWNCDFWQWCHSRLIHRRVNLIDWQGKIWVICILSCFVHVSICKSVDGWKKKVALSNFVCQNFLLAHQDLHV